MNNKKIAVLWLSIAMIFSLILIIVEVLTPVKAGTIWVDDDYGSEDATHKMTIQAAVDAANPGDTVFVYNGIYIENVLINKTLTLIGEDKNLTIVDGNSAGIVFRVDWTAYVNISGFTLRNGISGVSLVNSNYCFVGNNLLTNNDVGFSTSGSFNRIANNTITNCADYGYTVYDYFNFIEQSNTVDGEIIHYYYDIHGTEITPILLDGLNLMNFNVSTVGKINLINCSYVIVENSNLSNNIGNNFYGGGIYIRYSENITIYNTTLFNNHAGIYTVFSNNISIINDDFIFNDAYGTYFLDSNYGYIIDNSFINNTIGLKGVVLRNRTIRNNTFISSDYDAYLDIFCDNNIIDSNEFFGSKGFYFRGTINNILLNNTINTTSGYGFEVHNSEQLFIINSTIKSNSYNFYFKYRSGSVWEEGTVYIINSSFNDSKVYYYDDTIDLVRQWYLHINVTDSLGNPIPNATVSIEDFQNSLPAQKYTTDSEGYIRWLTQTEYIEQDTNGDTVGEKTYFTPHRITAWNETLMGYAEVNINESKEVNIVLDTPYYEIPLSAGWNLISLPLVQSDTSISTVLSSIAGNYDIVQWYNASDGNWHSTNDDLTDINHTMGFWIHMKTADTLIVTGTIPNTTFIQLYRGWNLVGNPSFCIHGIDDILSSIATKYTAVQQYDSWDSGDPWKHYHINKPQNLNDLAYMTSGRGYWLYVKEDCVWEVSNF